MCWLFKAKVFNIRICASLSFGVGSNVGTADADLLSLPLDLRFFVWPSLLLLAGSLAGGFAFRFLSSLPVTFAFVSFCLLVRLLADLLLFFFCLFAFHLLRGICF